eukprot:4814232-Amphidinium_carterae.1
MGRKTPKRHGSCANKWTKSPSLKGKMLQMRSRSRAVNSGAAASSPSGELVAHKGSWRFASSMGAALDFFTLRTTNGSLPVMTKNYKIVTVT